jgi:hypothetical protein
MTLAVTIKLNIADSASLSRRAANRESGELLLPRKNTGGTSAARLREKKGRWTRPLPIAFRRATHRVGTPESDVRKPFLQRKELYGGVIVDEFDCGESLKAKRLNKVYRTAA